MLCLLDRASSCWCYVVFWLGWCGIRMQAETDVVCSCGMWGLGLMTVWNRGFIKNK